MTKTTRTTYKDAGVDISAGNQLVLDIKNSVNQTKRPEVLTSLGGYAGLFALDLKKYPNPVLVSTTDGVGTKLKLAFQMNIFDSVGIDLVAMCVNDLICCGAEPLFFLDYFATGSLNVSVAQQVITEMSKALKEINCTLIGGETAEMPGFYQKGEFDLAGFAVGVVNREEIIDGHNIVKGDVLIGLASSGVHSNGFSLVRAILEKNKINPQKDTLTLEKPIGLELLTPTIIYVNPLLDLKKKFNIKGMAHITGGGLVENLPRILPKEVGACIEKSKIQIPRIFSILQKLGDVPEEEMWRVFNMGVGYVLVVSESDVDVICHALSSMNLKAYPIGTIVTKQNFERGVVLV